MFVADHPELEDQQTALQVVNAKLVKSDKSFDSLPDAVQAKLKQLYKADPTKGPHNMTNVGYEYRRDIVTYKGFLVSIIVTLWIWSLLMILYSLQIIDTFWKWYGSITVW